MVCFQRFEFSYENSYVLLNNSGNFKYIPISEMIFFVYGTSWKKMYSFWQQSSKCRNNEQICWSDQEEFNIFPVGLNFYRS